MIQADLRHVFSMTGVISYFSSTNVHNTREISSFYYIIVFNVRMLFVKHIIQKNIHIINQIMSLIKKSGLQFKEN